MPVPSRKLKDLIEGTWTPGQARVMKRIPLCRIEYLGDDENWGFAIYDPATETYTPGSASPGLTASRVMRIFSCRIGTVIFC